MDQFNTHGETIVAFLKLVLESINFPETSTTEAYILLLNHLFRFLSKT